MGKMCQGLLKLDIVVQCGTDRAFQSDTPHLFDSGCCHEKVMKSKQFHYGHMTSVIVCESNLCFENNLLSLFLSIPNLQMYKTTL